MNEEKAPDRWVRRQTGMVDSHVAGRGRHLLTNIHVSDNDELYRLGWILAFGKPEEKVQAQLEWDELQKKLKPPKKQWQGRKKKKIKNGELTEKKIQVVVK